MTASVILVGSPLVYAGAQTAHKWNELMRCLEAEMCSWTR